VICISIAQESRRFALVDMLNAARQCDLLEVQLDRFGKAPDVGELLDNKPKPIIFCCRRPRDGGHWDGTEEERLAILRQCIVSKADYVEIELDVADQVRRFPPCKRVISYTNLQETPADLAAIYAQAQTKSPDVIKIVTRAQTPEEAWPLVQILGKPQVPTVVVGLGPSGPMLTLLAGRMGAPWAYAALERGMEAYPGQRTVSDLHSVYHYQAIGKGTRFVGVIGSGERELLCVALVNAALAQLQLPQRCLPLEVGSLRLFRKMIEAVKLSSVLVDQEHQKSIIEMTSQLQGAAERVGVVDLIAHQDEQWKGFLMLDRAVVAALELTLRQKSKSDRPLEGRTVMIAGLNPLSRAVAQRLARKGVLLVVTGRDPAAAHSLAHELNCRHVRLEALYTTLHDVLLSGPDEVDPAVRTALSGKEGAVHPGYLKSGMTVVDLHTPLRRTELLREAALRGCGVVPPTTVLLEQVLALVKLITGKDVAPEPLRQLLDNLYIEEEEE